MSFTPMSLVGGVWMAGWEIVGTELLLGDDEGRYERVSSELIWKLSHASADPHYPPLEPLGLSFRGRLLTLSLKMREGRSHAFGCLELEAVSPRGIRMALSADHQSDHIVCDGVWYPLPGERMTEIFEYLNEHNLSLRNDLTAQQYLVVVRDMRDKDWFDAEYAYTANGWTERSVSQAERSPATFVGKLYEYQSAGSGWLSMMRRNGIGVILGDGMGLGKTIQIIKTTCDLLDDDPEAHVLIICPSSLIENWAREIEQFSRGVKYLVNRGPQRTRYYRDFLTVSIVITSYDTAVRDIAILKQVLWDMVVLDEAQAIKNPNTQRTASIKKLNRKQSIAVTGTPFENHMEDIWSIMDFCLPGYLGSQREFESYYSDDMESALGLRDIISPVLLRRRLSDIPNDLPPLVAIPMPIALEPREAQEYEDRRARYTEAGASLGAINNLITDLALPVSSDRHLSSLKYEYLDTVLSEIVGYREKIIVFAERNATIDELYKRYRSMLNVHILNGSIPINRRQTIIDEFSICKDSAMLICNTTVAGTGLNITAANHIFHFSMQWNPAKVDQADARAHRKGQTRTVFVHYPYYSGTVEEYMWQKVQEKRVLAEAAVRGNKADSDANDIARALAMSPIRHHGK